MHASKYVSRTVLHTQRNILQSPPYPFLIRNDSNDSGIDDAKFILLYGYKQTVTCQVKLFVRRRGFTSTKLLYGYKQNVIAYSSMHSRFDKHFCLTLTYHHQKQEASVISCSQVRLIGNLKLTCKFQCFHSFPFFFSFSKRKALG